MDYEGEPLSFSFDAIDCSQAVRTKLVVGLSFRELPVLASAGCSFWSFDTGCRTTGLRALGEGGLETSADFY